MKKSALDLLRTVEKVERRKKEEERKRKESEAWKVVRGERIEEKKRGKAIVTIERHL